MRQNIRLYYGDKEYGHGTKVPQYIYFYSHWDGNDGMSGLKKMLQAALLRKERWDDESYLAAIIARELLRNDLEGTTGYGIAPYETDPEFPTIEVDMVNKTVDGEAFADFIRKIK